MLPIPKFSYVYHAICFYQFAFSALYLLVTVPLSDEAYHPGMVGKLKYLTIWNLIIQFIYYLIAVVDDFYQYTDNDPDRYNIIKEIRDLVFSSIAFPISWTVVTTFWIVYTIDPALVVPPHYDEYVSPFMNHVIHTNVGICSAFELLIVHHTYPKKIQSRLFLNGISIYYLLWICLLAFSIDVWAYPILKLLFGWKAFLLICAVVAELNLFCYLGETINAKVWGSSQRRVPEFTHDAMTEKTT